MKKVLVSLILAIVLAGMVSFLIIDNVKAQPRELKECCVLGHDVAFKVGGATITCAKNTVVGASGRMGPCRVGGYSGCTNFDYAVASGTIKESMWGIFCLVSTIYTVTDWVFYILLIVAVLMIVIGGFLYMTAAGDPEKAGKGKSVIVFAIIGLVIALLAKVIPSIVKFIMGMGM